nr:HEAT repeat domain-containing protein [Paludisphaera mucosa]
MFLVALCESDEEILWGAMYALHRRAAREILDRALALCASACPFERGRGADVLGRLGVPDPAYPEECLRTLLAMLEVETDAGALASVLFALGHQSRGPAVAPAARFRTHPDSEVRYAVVHVLSCIEETWAIEGLIELSRDPEPRIRDWSTFGLGSMTDADSPAIRDALSDRLADEDFDTRSEALIGLARRKDHRVVPALRDELAGECVGCLAVEAAAEIADPGLHPLLLALRAWWDVDVQGLETAIAACTPPSESRIEV